MIRVYPQALFLFCCILQLTGLQWMYSNPPPLWLSIGPIEDTSSGRSTIVQCVSTAVLACFCCVNIFSDHFLATVICSTGFSSHVTIFFRRMKRDLFLTLESLVRILWSLPHMRMMLMPRQKSLQLSCQDCVTGLCIFLEYH